MFSCPELNEVFHLLICWKHFLVSLGKARWSHHHSCVLESLLRKLKTTQEEQCSSYNCDGLLASYKVHILDKGLVFVLSTVGAGVALNVITLLRIAYNLNCMNCLFLELSIECIWPGGDCKHNERSCLPKRMTVSACPACKLGSEPRVSHLPDKRSITKLQSKLYIYTFYY